MRRISKERQGGWRSFRTKLLLSMMLVVSAVSGMALYVAERSAAATAEQNIGREFRAELKRLHELHDVRQASIFERSQILARKSRIRASLEDGALDLLYPSARDELRDFIVGRGPSVVTSATATPLRAVFYRFLDQKGGLIRPPTPNDVGPLSLEDENRLALPGLPDRPQVGYIPVGDGRSERVLEVFAVPIQSSDTGDPISALVLGFETAPIARAAEDEAIVSGVFTHGRLYLGGLSDGERQEMETTLLPVLMSAADQEQSLLTELRGESHLVFLKRLNPFSQYPAAYEVCIYPLSDLARQKRQLRWQVLGSGIALLLGGFVASHFIAGGFSRPVERMAKDSEQNRAARQKAEAALEMTQEELQRSARFSADASHQLKTPVTVLRAGLEEMLARHSLTPEQANELSSLIHQTYRLNSVIEDLLLLSRMDAGRLRLEIGRVNLTALLEGWLDDLSALPDPNELTIETEIPPRLFVQGEKRYTSLILQNLLENARKYNRPKGRIRVTARVEGEWVRLVVNNTGRGIPAEMQSHIFERFHRAAIGENIPGHGLGLNLARELAKLHQGELRLAHSVPDDTEFEVSFRLSP